MKHQAFKFTVVISRNASYISPAQAQCDACCRVLDAKKIQVQYGPMDIGEYFICDVCKDSALQIAEAVRNNRRSIHISLELSS